MNKNMEKKKSKITKSTDIEMNSTERQLERLHIMVFSVCFVPHTRNEEEEE